MMAAAGSSTMVGASLAAEQAGEEALLSPLGSYLAGRFAISQHRLGDAADLMVFALEHDPENLGLLRRSHALLASEGRFDDAVKLALRLEELVPDNPGSNLTMVLRAARGGDWETVASRLQGLPGEGLNRIYVPLIGAWAELGKGSLDTALSRLALLEEVGVEPLLRIHEGLLYEVAERPEDADRSYTAALEAGNAPSLRVAAIIGNFYERNGRSEEARKLYADYAQANPETYLLSDGLDRLAAAKVPDPLIATVSDGMAEALFNIAGLLSQGETENLSITYARAALYLRPEFELDKVLIGELLQNQGRAEDAIAIYRDIPEGSKFRWAARQRIADELDKLGRIDEALEVLASLAAEHPNRVAPLLRKGNMLRRAERYEEAAVAYDEAVSRVQAVDRRHWTLFYFRGIALERVGEWDRAEADFLKALELEPEQPQVMNYLAYSWVEQLRNLDQAQDMLVRAAELRPNDGYIVDSLGWALYRLSQFEEAVGHLERAVELSPQDPVINDHLGDAYWRVGRRAEARFQWRRALSFEPEDEEIVNIERKLEQGLKIDDTAEDI